MRIDFSEDGWPKSSLPDSLEDLAFGMVSWGINDDEGQYNGAKMLDVFCVKILKCEYEYDGEKTWFDYGD